MKLRHLMQSMVAVYVIFILHESHVVAQSRGELRVPDFFDVVSSMSQAYKSAEIDQVQDGPAMHPSHLIRCINKGFNSTGLSWASAMERKPFLGSVKVMGAWWSQKSSKIPVTLVTQQSVERLGQLRAQCTSWRGPLSTVVYTSMVQVDGSEIELSTENRAILAAVVQQVAAFIVEVESIPSMCALDVLLVYEVFSDHPASMLYPFNMLRNLARLQARTPVLAMFDGDLTVSQAFSDVLSSPETAAALVKECSQQSLFVLPCFETTKNIPLAEAVMLADSGCMANKEELVNLVDAGVLQMFDAHRYKEGHLSTDYNRWYAASEAYPITPDKGYEPYILIDRIQAPWHDVRFRGYGSDKVTYIAYLNSRGFEFKVHPDGWVIHRPHTRSTASDAFFSSYKKVSGLKHRNLSQQNNSLGVQLRNHVQGLERQTARRIKQGTYTPVLDKAMKHCFDTLPWW